MRILESIKRYAQISRIALVCDEEEMTYKELDNLSEAVGSFLIEEIGDNKKPIVLYGNKENMMMAVMIGALKSGRAYIPIDISYPKERVDTIIEEVKPDILFDFSEGNIFSGIKVIYKHDIDKIYEKYKGIEIDRKRWSRMMKMHTYYLHLEVLVNLRVCR